MKIWKIAIVLALIVGVSCEQDDSTSDSESGSNDTFDRGVMLVHWADNIIVPSYTDLSQKTTVLDASITTFNENPTLQGFQEVRDNWLLAYRSFQKASMFEIGKAEVLNYRNRLNVYPTDTSQIEGLISQGAWNFELPSTIVAQGFPAMDYLLYGRSSDAAVFALFTTDANADNYKAYLKSLSETINNLTSQVLTDWNSNFRDTYVANTSSSASGAVDQTLNAYMFYYEKALRAGKVGIPAGVFSPDPLPQKVESLYKGDMSKDLLLEALMASQMFFNGNGTIAGPSLNEYLDKLLVVKNGSSLSALINNQFIASENKINNLSNNFTEQITQDNSQMLSAYDELQRNVVLMKVDMFQALSVDINYVDADGD